MRTRVTEVWSWMYVCSLIFRIETDFLTWSRIMLWPRQEPMWRVLQRTAYMFNHAVAFSTANKMQSEETDHYCFSFSIFLDRLSSQIVLSIMTVFVTAPPWIDLHIYMPLVYLFLHLWALWVCVRLTLTSKWLFQFPCELTASDSTRCSCNIRLILYSVCQELHRIATVFSISSSWFFLFQ